MDATDRFERGGSVRATTRSSAGGLPGMSSSRLVSAGVRGAAGRCRLDRRCVVSIAMTRGARNSTGPTRVARCVMAGWRGVSAWCAARRCVTASPPRQSRVQRGALPLTRTGRNPRRFGRAWPVVGVLETAVTTNCHPTRRLGGSTAQTRARPRWPMHGQRRGETDAEERVSARGVTTSSRRARVAVQRSSALSHAPSGRESDAATYARRSATAIAGASTRSLQRSSTPCSPPRVATARSAGRPSQAARAGGILITTTGPGPSVGSCATRATTAWGGSRMTRRCCVPLSTTSKLTSPRRGV